MLTTFCFTLASFLLGCGGFVYFSFAAAADSVENACEASHNHCSDWLAANLTVCGAAVAMLGMYTAAKLSLEWSETGLLLVALSGATGVVLGHYGNIILSQLIVR